MFAGRKERVLAGGVCRNAGAGGAEGGSSPPGAAQCGGSFQPVSGRAGWPVGIAAAESLARWDSAAAAGALTGRGWH